MKKETKRRRVTILVGSGSAPRGATMSAAQRFAQLLAEGGDVQVEIVLLNEASLGLCRGCKVCFEKGERLCPLGGDMESLLEKMDGSDGVVFATPNHAFQVSAVMKAFLDRLAFCLHRPRFHGKCFSSIVVQGVYGGKGIERYLRFVGNGLGFNTIQGSCLTTIEPATRKALSRNTKLLEKQSRRFLKSFMKPSYPVPTLFNLMVFRAARTSIGIMLDEGNLDYRYYRDKGWFSSHYYYEVRIGPVKRLIGALFDLIFSISNRPDRGGRSNTTANSPLKQDKRRDG